MAKSKKKKLFIILSIIIAISIIVLGVIKAKNNEGNSSAVFVNTVDVITDSINSDITSQGIISVVEERNIVSILPYTIEEILVKEGDKVSKGDILAKLDTKNLKLNTKTAEINLEIQKNTLKKLLEEVDTYKLEKNVENAKNTYENALTKYQNSKQLHEAGAISETQLDADYTAYVSASSSYEIAKKDLEDAKNPNNNVEIIAQKKKIEIEELNLQEQKNAIEKSNIKSTLDGTIVTNNAKIGVSASTVSPLFIIDNMDVLQISASISEFDVNNIGIGQKVKITGDAFKNSEFEGVVSYIAPSANVRQTSTGVETNVKIKIDIINPTNELKPGFSADITIRVAEKGSALVVPYETIYQRKDGKDVVFKVEDGKLKEIEVTKGVKGDIKVEILSENIKEGDKIVNNPSEKYKDGMEVQITNVGETK
ncbi:efflux RND transporter periplasmic adaptor subunit [Abyssisolibacter fermentans]|uniref:efflux RND transporter periplasmic adaptor subunit n=1 Tax=Abyssisolibacter fermentans TaxID=1766203 RepID=UPI00082D808A|nr:efflux RND transporter periplasmic adaptor subunit [Abyssisolibacter fermentans]